MRNKLLFSISFLGLAGGCLAAYLFAMQTPPLPPAFSPASNPYAKAIYAEGIVESEQTNGVNINMYPEVSGTVKEILVSEGQKVAKGAPLLLIDDSIQKAAAEQLRFQAQAAFSMLEELKAQPRKENLDVAAAQVVSAQAALKTATDTLDKQEVAYEADPRSVSKDALDNAVNATALAKANLSVAQRQYDLTKAGAWIYDIQTQERQYHALHNSYLSSSALLAKYTLRAPQDASVMSINAAMGGFVSPQGAYDNYTQGADPVLVLGSTEPRLDVRCYVDEILVARIPLASKVKAQMTIRGTDVKVPLEFVRVQPYVTPKIQLSNEKTERVDVRVLPVIFRIEKPKNVNLYPGELVDVYISE